MTNDERIDVLLERASSVELRAIVRAARAHIKELDSHVRRAESISEALDSELRRVKQKLTKSKHAAWRLHVGRRAWKWVDNGGARELKRLLGGYVPAEF